MKLLHQLCIEKLIEEDWSGTVYRSRLYKSKEACLRGCRTTEIVTIAGTVFGHMDTSDLDEYPYEDGDELANGYKAQEPEAVKFVELVRESLLHLTAGSIFDKSGIFCDWISRELAEDET